MLVLARHVNETIVIDRRITVTVLEIRGDKVRLGVTAPMNIAVHRAEVQIAIDRTPADGSVHRVLIDDQPCTIEVTKCDRALWCTVLDEDSQPTDRQFSASLSEFLSMTDKYWDTQRAAQ